jgi:outer membrane protein
MTALTCAGVSLPVGAQTGGEGSQSATQVSRWALGFGVASRQLPYAGVERDNKAIPLLYFENGWVRVAGGNAELKLLHKAFTPTQAMTAGLRLKYDDEGYKAKDSPRLSGMEERKGGFWGGALVTWRNPVAQLSAEWVADLSGNSKGKKLQLQVDRRFAWSSFSLTPRVQAQWLDKKYVDYYFGVRAAEATLGRAAYIGQSAMAIEAGLRMDYTMSSKHSVFLDLSATWLADEIKFSPIVDRGNSSRVAVGYLYRF